MTTKGNHLVFYGASDDLAECVEIVGLSTEEDVEEACNDANGKPISFLVRDPSTGDRCLVVFTYTHAGTWSVGVAQVDEGAPMPAPWHIYYDAATQAGYSVRLHVVGAPGHVFCVVEVRS